MLYAIRLDSNYMHIKRILQFVEDWKYEYCLTSKRALRRKSLANDSEIIRWTYKSCDKIEFSVRNYSHELKNILEQELKKVNCSSKFTIITNSEYKLVIKIKKSPICSIL
jgi:hypothetical protein